MSTSRIVHLAELISSKTAIIDTYISDNGLSPPSFHPDCPADPIEDADVVKAKNEVLEATIELRQLLGGPMKLLLPESNFAPLAAIYEFNIASKVPLGSSISFTDLAPRCNLLEHDLRRIIRYAAVHHRVFSEPKKGFVAHTAASKLLAQNPVARDLMGLTFQECWPAHGRAIEAMAQKSEDASVSGYALANNFTSSTRNTFQFLSEHPIRAQQFARAMSSTSKASMDALCNNFDWTQIPTGSTVVDIGGSQGHVSVHLAQKYPHLQFVVQDLAEVVEGAAVRLPVDVKERVEFMAHDMFTEQPVRDAEVYLLRFVLHDWQDPYCVDVLQKLVPGLKNGARVVIQEHLLPEPGAMTLLQEMQVRYVPSDPEWPMFLTITHSAPSSMDAIMLSLFNSRERDQEDWMQLFAAASTKFKFFTVHRIEESPTTGIITAQWSG
ncbi:hypothetical protein FQN49_003324 [Arthroderma sp. PD_2]|nr:hypothetical protein FQN49_003324 [Arthroderma sp. PD_2]